MPVATSSMLPELQRSSALRCGGGGWISPGDKNSPDPVFIKHPHHRQFTDQRARVVFEGRGDVVAVGDELGGKMLGFFGDGGEGGEEGFDAIVAAGHAAHGDAA